MGFSVASVTTRDQNSWEVEGAGFTWHQGSNTDSADAILVHRKDFQSYCKVLNSLPPVEVYEFDVGGGTTLTIDILAVNVHPSATTVQSGQSVHFSSAPINFARTGAITWGFDTLAYADPILVTSCTNLLVCDYVPTKTGRMMVCMYDEQNYSICSESSVVSVIKCPTGDSLLDNPVLRAALLQALEDSWADSLPISRRREVAGYAYFDSTGLHVVRTEDPAKYFPCGVSYTAPPWAVLIFHTHPFNPPEGFTPADTLPTVCGKPGKTLAYDTKTWGGPSDTDWAASVRTGKPSYIIDKKRLYKTDPSITDSTMWADSTKKYDWNTRKCRW